MAAKAQECDMTLLIDDFVLISTNPKKENGAAALLPRRQSPTRMRNLSSKSEKAFLNTYVFVQQDTSQVSKVAEMQMMELREQLVAFKVRNRDVEEERKVVKGKVRKEREAMKGFEG
jgi:hypothetical protein